MSNKPTVGLVVPFATDRVPDEGLLMYPDANFLPRGVGVRALTPEGYDPAWNGILPAARELAARGVCAIMAMGASLTFYRGYAAHQELLDQIRRETGLPVSSMSASMLEGLRSVGARRIAVATAYSDEVNRRFLGFLTDAGFEVLGLRGFGLTGFGDAEKKSERDIIDLANTVVDETKSPDAVLISCGGLMTYNCAEPIESRHDIPVVASNQAAFWKAVRLAGESGRITGHGRMLAQSEAVAA